MRALANTISATEARATGHRAILIGAAAVVTILAVAALLLFLNLPDPRAFNTLVERLFVEGDYTAPQELRLLEQLAASTTAFSEVLSSYRTILFVVLLFATASLVAAVTFLVMLLALTQRMGQIQRKGIEVASLVIARESNSVYLNDFELKLTDAAMETLSVLAEARMDDEILSGAQIEGVISGRDPSECDEAAGATRIKRLRDTLGNQMVSELLVRNIARRGYTLAVDKGIIRMT